MWNPGVIVVFIITVKFSASESFIGSRRRPYGIYDLLFFKISPSTHRSFVWTDFEDIDDYSEYNYVELQDEDHEEDSNTKSKQNLVTESTQYNNASAVMHNDTDKNMYNNDINADMYNNTRTNMYSETSTVMYNDITTEMYGETGTDMNSVISTVMYNNTSTKAYSETSTDGYNGRSTDMYNNTTTEMYSEIGTNMDNDVSLDRYNNIDKHMDCEPGTDIYYDISSEMYSETDTDMNNDINTEIYGEIDTEITTKIYNDINTEFYNSTNTEIYYNTAEIYSTGTEMNYDNSTEHNIKLYNVTTTDTYTPLYNTGIEDSKKWQYNEVTTTERYDDFDNWQNTSIKADLNNATGTNMYPNINTILYNITSTEMYNNTSTEMYNNIGTKTYNNTGTEIYNNHSTETYNSIGTKLYNNTGTEMYNNTSTETFNNISTTMYNNTGTEMNNNTSTEMYNNTSTKMYNNTNTEIYHDIDSKEKNTDKDISAIDRRRKAAERTLNLRRRQRYGFLYHFGRRSKVILTEKLCPENATCARKCCSSGKAYDLTKNSCVTVENSIYTFNPTLWLNYKWLQAPKAATDVLTFLSASITCPASSGEVRIPVTEISQVFRLSVDGNLYVEMSRSMAPEWLMFKTNKYCMDLFVAEGERTKLNALICHVPEINELTMHYYLSGICMLVTCFLVLLRVLIFAWVPELQTLHGKILMAYLINFLVGFLLLAIEQFLTIGSFISGNMCYILTMTVYFCTLSAYFWRNVMCYDIWWTFSGKRAISGSGSSSRARFRLYSAYAFSGPMVLTVVLALLEFYDLPNYYPLMPRIRNNCFLLGYGRLLYFLGPIMLLFIMNMIFFTRTALKIAAIKKQNKMILQTKDSCTQRSNTRRFRLYVKLFGSMAFLEFNLVLEILTILNGNTVNIMYISDAFNVLAPFIIIVNFLCRKQTWKMIRKRLGQNGYLKKQNNILTHKLLDGLTTLEPSQEKSGFDRRKTGGLSLTKEDPACCQYWDDV